MVKKEANLTAVMLVQQLDKKYWLSSDYVKPLQKAKAGDVRPLLEMIIDKLKDNNINTIEAYIIRHDKDKTSTWDANKLKNEVKNKAVHVHVLLKFQQGASLNKLALAIGVEKQYLEKLKSGRYGYENCLAYLVHAKDETKYQYKPEDVHTVLGEDYQSVYHRKIESWIKGRATKRAKETNLDVDWLIDKILKGEVTKSNIMLTNEYYAVYGQHKRKINEALETAGERRSYRTIAELEAGRFKKTVFFIQADSGVGKTKFSKKLISLVRKLSIKKGQLFDVCVTASVNAFDEYEGQEILFLDDIRGDSLTVSDWLKLLDPFMISPISARYRNKMGAAKIIVITSTNSPLSFFSKAKGNHREDLGQFLRRIDYLIEIKDGFHFSEPKKKTDLEGDKICSEDIIYNSSFKFVKISRCSEKEARFKLLNRVVENLQWRKVKKTTFETDQSSKGSLNEKQK